MSVQSINDGSGLDKIPMSANDGTLRYFLSLSDISDNVQSAEDLAKIPKFQPSNEKITIEQDTGFQNIPLPAMEKLLGINVIHDDVTEDMKVFNFLKNQYSFGKDFKDKFGKFPEEFYKAIDKEGKIEYQHHFDQSGNYSLRKV